MVPSNISWNFPWTQGAAFSSPAGNSHVENDFIIPGASSALLCHKKKSHYPWRERSKASENISENISVVGLETWPEVMGREKRQDEDVRTERTVTAAAPVAELLWLLHIGDGALAAILCSAPCLGVRCENKSSSGGKSLFLCVRAVLTLKSHFQSWNERMLFCGDKNNT